MVFIVNRAFSIHFFTALTSRNTICSRTREELYSVYKMVKKDHFLWKRMKKMSWYFFFFLPNRMSIHWLWHGAVHGIFYANFLTWFQYARKLGRQDVGTGRRVAVTSDLLRFDLHFYFLLFWYVRLALLLMTRALFFLIVATSHNWIWKPWNPTMRNIKFSYKYL